MALGTYARLPRTAAWPTTATVATIAAFTRAGLAPRPCERLASKEGGSGRGGGSRGGVSTNGELFPLSRHTPRAEGVWSLGGNNYP
jgi:hypothetical protein